MADLPGYISDTELYYEEDAEPLVDESVPCCSAEEAPFGGAEPNPGDTPVVDPFRPLPAWEAFCSGGGTVPSVSDVVKAEDWSA